MHNIHNHRLFARSHMIFLFEIHEPYTLCTLLRLMLSCYTYDLHWYVRLFGVTPTPPLSHIRLTKLHRSRVRQSVHSKKHSRVCVCVCPHESKCFVNILLILVIKISLFLFFFFFSLIVYTNTCYGTYMCDAGKTAHYSYYNCALYRIHLRLNCALCM